MVLALVQIVVGILSPALALAGIPTLVIAAVWLVIAVQTTAVRRIPKPVTAPIVIDAVRPLPGESEGAGAGWYRVSAGATRWWTGTRWSQYMGSVYGIRPTFHAATAMRTLKGVAVGVIALAVLAVVIGVALVVTDAIVLGGVGDAAFSVTVIGWAVAAGGLLIGLVGAGVVAVTRFQMRTLLMPASPPAPAPPSAPASAPANPGTAGIANRIDPDRGAF